MQSILEKFVRQIDNFSIRKKMIFIYIFCMLLPITLTDGVIIYTVLHTEAQLLRSEMEDIADAVSYQIFYDVDTVSKVAKSIYTSQYINDFLETKYEDPFDYVVHYQQFFKDTLFQSADMTGSSVITLYTDNETIVSGGTVRSLDLIKGSEWYQDLSEKNTEQMLYFAYEPDIPGAVMDPERHVYFLSKMNYYGGGQSEKMLKLEMDYSTINRNLQNLNYDMPVYICHEGKIIFSNRGGENIGDPFANFSFSGDVEYLKISNIYGAELEICVLRPETNLTGKLAERLPILVLLFLINILFPLLMVLLLNRSLTARISKLSSIFRNTEDENLIEIEDVAAKDEIGDLMRNYNRMASRIKTLVKIVYKNKIREQEMTVARQKAELLALRSQINPHFLFNALESIRMHSVIKKEKTTAEMVEKLAVMQRQYVDWGEDIIEVGQEMDIVRNYMDLQQYRFGTRLSYELDVEDECQHQKIPKLTIVTFAENACVHGIEKKTVPGWVFIRVYRENEKMCIEVEDTGEGMTENEINSMRQKMENASIELLENEKGVGVINACLRLKMMSHDRVHFELSGEEGTGVTVLIRLPFIES